MSRTLVGDVAHVVWIDTFRSPPLIIHGSMKAKPALDRAFGLWARFIESPAKLRHKRPLRV